MNIPADLKYTREHEWARVDGDIATVGISDYAQEELGDIVNVELPEEGDAVRKDEPFGAVESVKASVEIFAPVSGTVIEINEPLLDAPETLNEDPYDDGWLIKIRMSKPAEIAELMSAADYIRYLKEESK